jgi:hypothetical protein
MGERWRREKIMALKLSELRKIGSKKREKVKVVRWMKKEEDSFRVVQTACTNFC